MPDRSPSLSPEYSTAGESYIRGRSLARQERILGLQDRVTTLQDKARGRDQRGALSSELTALDPNDPGFMGARDRILANYGEAAALDPVGQVAATFGLGQAREASFERKDNRDLEDDMARYEKQMALREEAEKRRFDYSEELRKQQRNDPEALRDLARANGPITNQLFNELLEIPDLDAGDAYSIAQEGTFSHALVESLVGEGATDDEIASLMVEKDVGGRKLAFVDPAKASLFRARKAAAFKAFEFKAQRYSDWEHRMKAWEDAVSRRMVNQEGSNVPITREDAERQVPGNPGPPPPSPYADEPSPFSGEVVPGLNRRPGYLDVLPE